MFTVVVKKLANYQVVEHSERAETYMDAKEQAQTLLNSKVENVISDALIMNTKTNQIVLTVQNKHKD